VFVHIVSRCSVECKRAERAGLLVKEEASAFSLLCVAILEYSLLRFLLNGGDDSVSILQGPHALL
jgi:hypothetical protein